MLQIICANYAVAQIDSLPADTLLKTDSIGIERTVNKEMPFSSGALEEEVRYQARDSIVYDILNKKVYLYGLGVIDYQDLHLEAHKIVIDWSKNEMWAYSRMDSAGKKVKEQVKLAEKTRTGEADSLAYNFKSKKGKIYNFRTKEGNAYVIIDEAKKNERDIMYASNSKFTTCDAKHPHFWLELDRAKIIPEDKVVTSYAYPVVEGVPIYFAFLPFGFIPTNTSKATSGVLFPKYGFSPGRGYFLQDGGYYFALSNKMDLSLTADIFSYGSWGAAAKTNYKVRYKYSGSADVNFNKNFYDNGKGEFEPTNEFLVQWSHRQDPKSIPGMTFSSSVNVGTAGFNRNNSFDNDEILNSRLRSSINFSKNFKNSPFRLSVALNHDQNLQDRKINLTLPNTNLAMDRIQPFEKVRNKNLLILRNLGFTHNLSFQNRLSTYDSLLFDPDTVLDWNRGLAHSIPINTSFKLAKWITVTPAFNYRGYYNFYRDVKGLNDAGKIESRRENGSFYAFDYNMSTTLNTTLYGTYRFNKSESLVALRHVVVPSVNFNYTPDFTTAKWGYYDSVITNSEPDTNGIYEYQFYNKYSLNPLGQTQRGKVGSIGFGVNNTIELKLKDRKDTIKVDATKKVKIIESMSLSGNYNFFSDSMQLSTISARARTTLFKMVSIQSSATLNPYAQNADGGYYDAYLWDVDRKIIGLQSFNINVGTSLRKTMIEKWKKELSVKKKDNKKGIVTPYTPFYTKYKFPFDLRVVYDFSVRKSGLEFNPKQTLNLTGSFEPTNKWNVRYTLNYDIANWQLSYTNLKFVRDLHCWEFSFDWTPTGNRKGFYFSIRARAAELQSLKIEKNSNFWDN